MKRILLALTLVLAVQVASAQATAEAARKAIAKAVEATENPKKATKVATWLALGKAYMGAYNQPTAKVVMGVSKTYLAEIMAEKPTSEVQVVVGDTPMTKWIFPDKELFFDASGNIVTSHVTKFPVDEPLYNAFLAYQKAHELDVQGSKTKDILVALEDIANKYVADAGLDFNLGDFVASSEKFEKAAEVSAAAPLSKPDGMSLANAGLGAMRASDYDRALELCKKALALSYYDEGNLFLRVAAIYAEKGDKASQKEYLEKGVEACPENKDLLISLIDCYLFNNEDPAKLFELTAKAIETNPTNAYPHYAQGIIYDQMSKSEQIKTDIAKAEECIENAAECFDRAAAVDPTYEFSFVGKGQMYYNRAIILSEIASAELDNDKWNMLRDMLYNYFEKATDPLKKGYEVSNIPDVKVALAELLKVCYYNLSSKDEKFTPDYEKWNAVYKELIK